jgi:hypothetical protein
VPHARAARRGLAALALAAGLAAAGARAVAAAEPSAAGGDAPPLRCRGGERDPWLADWRARADGDGLYRYAVERFGAPLACEGRRTGEAGEAVFGTLRFELRDGAAVSFETYPPEASRVTLLAPGGLGDEAEARAALERYARGVGLAIDWSKPEARSEGARRVTAFSDPEPGLNAAAELIHEGDRLVGLALRLAP